MSSDAAKTPGNPDFRVLLIGAAGNFGRRLAGFLAHEPGIAVILGGRTRATLDAVARDIGTGEAAEIDRNRIDPFMLRSLGIDMVVDASGPFQGADLRVIEAAIAAKVHYADLADARDFVARVPMLDGEARLAGVAVVTGASSTPALSHAALDAVTIGWRRIDTLRVAISPSNRQPRGRAVVEAILAGTGQPLRVWREGRDQAGHGWGGLRRIALPHIGRRWASWCETPDSELLERRYRPRVAAEFLASLELSVMHLGLAAIGRIVRAGLLRSARPLAVPLGWISDRLERFGSDWGGMVAEAKGQDADGRAASVRWWLRAKGDTGPNVPVLAALAIVRKLRNGTLAWRGAASCAGMLTLADFSEDFSALGIETGVETCANPEPAFRTAMGGGFERLPAVTRALHTPDPVLLWRGGAEVEGATNFAGRALARVFAFPKSGHHSLHVVIERDGDGSEAWSRVYPDRIMRSRMANPDPAAGTIEEHFGPFRFGLALTARADGIDMRLAGARLGPIPMPLFLLPRIAATERADGNRHRFDVSVDLPLVGRLVRYRGWLEKDV